MPFVIKHISKNRYVSNSGGLATLQFAMVYPTKAGALMAKK
jgi:hypothetical protein